MPRPTTRRLFLRQVGLSAAAFPFLCNLPSLSFASSLARKRRLVIMFSPCGVIQETFWPDAPGLLAGFKETLSPLEPYRDRTLTLHGISDKIRGDGDDHMRGIGCLLTGVELLPGNIMGGGGNPASWASGISIDQEIKNRQQQDPSTRTRFGSLEFGVVIPNRADTWTRMVYAGSNKPVTPVDDPYQMFNKLYGQMRDQEHLRSVLDDLTDDLAKIRSLVSHDDRHLLEEQTEFVRQFERQLEESAQQNIVHQVPTLQPGVVEDDDHFPEISKMQIDLLVNAFMADFARIATLQYSSSAGSARMKFLGVPEAQHKLSHEPDTNAEAQDKLTRVNKWFCQQMAYLAQRLAETPEPGGDGSMLDNTTIIWTNELGKGNSHTHDNLPFVMVGNGLGFRMGRALEYDGAPHNRLLISLAHAFGHPIERFGNPDYCGDGPLTGLA